MSALFQTLEDFTALAREEPTTPAREAARAVEKARAEAYERGYTSGWDDAQAAASSEQARLSSELAQALLDLNFTHHEARAHVMAAVEPVLREMVRTIMPRLAERALGDAILEEVSGQAAAITDTPPEILVAEVDMPTLAAFLEARSEVPFEVRGDASLAPGQAYLSLGGREQKFDFSGALERIEAAIDALEEANERNLSHG